MAEFREHLTTLDADPQNTQALSALMQLASGGDADRGGLAHEAAARALDDARRTFRERGEIELVARLYDVELAATSAAPRRADLLLEKGRLLFEELHDEPQAVAAFRGVLEVRPEDTSAQ